MDKEMVLEALVLAILCCCVSCDGTSKPKKSNSSKHKVKMSITLPDCVLKSVLLPIPTNAVTWKDWLGTSDYTIGSSSAKGMVYTPTDWNTVAELRLYIDEYDCVRVKSTQITSNYSDKNIVMYGRLEQNGKNVMHSDTIKRRGNYSIAMADR